MVYVVTDKKVYQTFDSISDAIDFQSRTLNGTVYEQDIFGNLKKIPEAEISQRVALDREAKQIEQKDKQNAAGQHEQKLSQQNTSLKNILLAEQPDKKNIIRYAIIAFIAIVVLIVVFVFIVPMLLDSYHIMNDVGALSIG